jgi:L-2,4-diaminobutyrate decarboxylase
MQEMYLNADNKEEILAHFNNALQMGVDFKLRNEVIESLSFDKIFEQINEPLPLNGLKVTECLDHMKEKVLPYSTNFSSPFAMAFPDAGNSVAALCGGILLNFINQNLINWSPCSPVGTVIEMIVLNWLRTLIGFEVITKPKTPLDVGGMVSTGGVSSNTVALLLAREKAFPGTMINGVGDINEEFVCIVPGGIEHYSSRIGLGWLGLGEKNVIKAPTINFKYDLCELSILMENLHSKNIKIISLVAYAGDSRSMTIDDFIEIRKLCDKYNTWMHVDGCHGTQLLFSTKLKGLLQGIELADSVTFDPHKVLNIPYTLSVLLLKNLEHMKFVQRPEDIITGEEHSFGQVTPFFGSKAFYSLKLYLLMKNLGVNGIGEMIEKRISIAKLLAKKISDSDDFILLNPIVNINSVIFMFCPKSLLALIKDKKIEISQLNELNTLIQKQNLESGKVWLHNFAIPDSANVLGLGATIILRPLRFMSGNPLVVEAHLDIMLEKIRETGKKILGEMVINKGGF